MNHLNIYSSVTLFFSIFKRANSILIWIFEYIDIKFFYLDIRIYIGVWNTTSVQFKFDLDIVFVLYICTFGNRLCFVGARVKPIPRLYWKEIILNIYAMDELVMHRQVNMHDWLTACIMQWWDVRRRSVVAKIDALLVSDQLHSIE